MDLEELEALIGTKEGQKLEFKKQPSGLAKEMVAFANTNDGKILIGVDDDGNIVGLEDINSKKSEVQDFARNCEPPVQIDMETVNDVLIVEVEKSQTIHRAPDGFYSRQGPNSQKLSKEEIIAIMQERGEVTFEKMICNEFTYPDDFDKDAFEKFLERADITDNLDEEQLLVNLGVAKEQDGYRFTNAGVLMFSENPKRFFIQAEIVCGAYESEEKANLRDREVIEEPMIKSIQRAEQFILGNIGKSISIEGLERKEIPEIPREALREAIVNAVMHRNYHETEESIQIDIFPNRIEVRNPGGLVEGMRAEDLGKKSMRRNPNIANLLDKVGFAERMGTGINRIKKAMDEADLPEPDFETNSHFQVNLQRREEKKLIDLSKAKLNERQKKALEVAFEKGTIDNSKYRKIADVHRQTAKRDLKDMVSKGILEKKGKTRGTHYIPKN